MSFDQHVEAVAMKTLGKFSHGRIGDLGQESCSLTEQTDRLSDKLKNPSRVDKRFLALVSVPTLHEFIFSRLYHAPNEATVLMY